MGLRVEGFRFLGSRGSVVLGLSGSGFSNSGVFEGDCWGVDLQKLLREPAYANFPLYELQAPVNLHISKF